MAASSIYSGSWLAPVGYDQFGNLVNNAVWTGSDSLGVAGFDSQSTGIPTPDLEFALGNSLVMPPIGSAGDADLAGSYGLSDGGEAQLQFGLPIYALSTPITVPMLTTLIGDVNGDHIVNAQDLALVSSSWLATGTNAADVNSDGIVNSQDLALVSSNWLATDSPAASAAVPEPSTLILAALGGLALLAAIGRSK